MPRPNKRRDVLAEDNLARRIAAERDARGWTNDGLASRMTAAGCALTGSAIFKIEKATPRRRIVVDELVVFAKVFGLSIEQLLLPPEAKLSQELSHLVFLWDMADGFAQSAEAKRLEAWEHLQRYVTEHPEAHDELRKVIGEWADGYFEEGHREGPALLKMWELTGDKKWDAAIEKMLADRRVTRKKKEGK